MKLKVLPDHRDENGVPSFALRRYDGSTHQYGWVKVPIAADELRTQVHEPVRLAQEPKYWLFRNRFVLVEGADSQPDQFVSILTEIMAPEKSKPWPTASSWEGEKAKALTTSLTAHGMRLQWDRSDLREMIWNARLGILPTRHSTLARHRPEELVLRIKHAVLTEEKALERLRREVDAFENFERIQATPREPVPDYIRMFVWQRDRGRCVKCGCQERLEFDHIIPLAKGGSNTERNIQLLCEPCNRTKGAIVS
jgi:5-methylcytosine-specific restriction endonuclease McrA